MNAALDSPSNREAGDYRRLDIDQIEPYDRNPRQLPNPKTHDLEASLRASGGLERVLAVTRRPGAGAYMVLEGGNTTLILLKKLLSETNDERFRHVTADIRPWPGDLDVMARHYRENNTRGDLSFGERSLEMLALYRQYCEEAAPTDSRPTVAKFCSYLAKRFGIPCAPSNFSLYKFTAEPLAEAMPFLVRRTRFTKAQAVAIRGRYNKIKAVWCDKDAGTKDEFDEAFFGLLARQDKALEKTFAREIADDPSSLPDIAYNDDELISGLQNEFARSEAIDCSYAQAGVWISAALHGGPKIIPRDALEADGDELPQADISTSPQTRATLPDVHTFSKDQTSETKDPPGNGHDAIEIALAHSVRSDSLAPHPLSPPKEGDDLPALRRNAYGYASRIAIRNGLQDLVVALPDSGFGYLLIEVHDDLMQAARTVSPSIVAWWALAAGCALSMTPEAVRDRVMPEDSFLRTTLDQGNIELLAQGYPFQSFDQSGRFWDALKAKDWSDFLAIQKLFKAMTVAVRGLHNLWSL
ncbi:hypothetical protein [Hyphococcus luteus]|uniref:hypothetical protein n=1 Tax=Hyphococcus luteus TaxID=2058213 RepID=UPI0013FD8D53|nr:hypothetical protein [Marinicaulis flavus]